MIGRRAFLHTLAVTGATGIAGSAVARAHGGAVQAPRTDGERQYWLSVLERLAEPILVNLAEGRLKERMPVELPPGVTADRRSYSHLEAFGRLLAGIAPWLEVEGLTGEEARLQTEYAALARKALDAATDPRSRDFMNFTTGGQPLVDAAFMAEGILRAPRALWERLDARTQGNVVAALQATRVIKPNFSNWLLFSATVEAALAAMGREWDQMRVDYAVRQHQQWYKGDGAYGDGPHFRWDYYNSFVIQPMLIDTLAVVSKKGRGWDDFLKSVMTRARRYAVVQERLISPEGTFPPIGRSIAYRYGAFHLLAQVALLRQLPPELPPAQVRSALGAVIRRTTEAPGTFDRDGWLTIGFCGHQPSLGERYISTGSLYLCAVGLLPLGLPPSDEFWAAPPAPWTSQRMWSGEDLKPDHALTD